MPRVKKPKNVVDNFHKVQKKRTKQKEKNKRRAPMRKLKRRAKRQAARNADGHGIQQAQAGALTTGQAQPARDLLDLLDDDPEEEYEDMYDSDDEDTDASSSSEDEASLPPPRRGRATRPIGPRIDGESNAQIATADTAQDHATPPPPYNLLPQPVPRLQPLGCIDSHEDAPPRRRRISPSSTDQEARDHEYH